MFAKNKGAYEQEIINAEDASFRANDATGFGSAVGDLFGVQQEVQGVSRQSGDLVGGVGGQQVQWGFCRKCGVWDTGFGVCTVDVT